MVDISKRAKMLIWTWAVFCTSFIAFWVWKLPDGGMCDAHGEPVFIYHGVIGKLKYIFFPGLVHVQGIHERRQLQINYNGGER
jgi:hypothetical protein